jgi:hypothetical protein
MDRETSLLGQAAKLGAPTRLAWGWGVRGVSVPLPVGRLRVPIILFVPAALLALAVRLPFLAVTDFPLNDGGLFYVMAAEIAAAGYRLPAFTSYNFAQIPFAYPPLALYLAAVLSDVFRLPLDSILRVLPLVANLGSIVALYLLARSLLGSWTTAAIAAGAFALLPRGFEWLVMGGGLTRSLGLLFALLALSQARALYERPSGWRWATSVVLVAATALSHLEMAVFAAYSFGLFALFFGPRVRSIAISVMLAVGVAILTAPWWGTVISTHGLAPFQAASRTSGWALIQESLKTLVTFGFTDERLFPVLAALGALGLLFSLLRGDLLLPIWLLLIFIGTPRSAATEACVPLAMLIARALAEVILPGISGIARGSATQQAWLRWLEGRLRVKADFGVFVSASAVTAILAYALVLSWLTFGWDRHYLHAVSPDERSAMQWIADHTPPSSQFLVISPAESWEVDYIYEWFPALAHRRSVLTVQGTEWLPAEGHGRTALLYTLFKIRRVSNVDDLEYWARQDCVKFTHVYLSKQASGPLPFGLLESSFASSPEYRTILDTPGATVLERSEPFPTRVGSQPVASDCKALVDESPDVQAAFAAQFGDRAPEAWLARHEQQLAAQSATSSAAAP